MGNSERSIFYEIGVWPSRATPAASTLLDTPDAPKASYYPIDHYPRNTSIYYYLVTFRYLIISQHHPFEKVTFVSKT